MSKSEDRMFVTPDGQRVWFTFALVSSLFLLWGFCNGMIDTMDKHFQNELGLTKSQSASVQFAHFLGYFLMALPAGNLAIRWGYRGGIIAGLLLVAVGGFWFIPSTYISAAAVAGKTSPFVAFTAYLVGVCAIAAGLTFLETIANPYTTVLGGEKYASTRINLAQSFCSLGLIIGPIVGAKYFYGEGGGSETLYLPYVAIAIGVLVLSVLFYFAPIPDIKMQDHFHIDDTQADSSTRSIWTHPHFVMAVVAQFCYVAAQAGIFSFLINYMTEETPSVSPAAQARVLSLANSGPSFVKDALTDVTRIGREVPEGKEPAAGSGAAADTQTYISDKGAATLASVGALFFFLGRIVGTFLTNRFPGHTLLGWFALVNVIACGVVYAKVGWISAWAVFVTYFFMSIMFPTIFALGIHGLGSRAKQASAFIVMAIIGGALVPKLMGKVADLSNMSVGFLIPAVCFVVIAAYGFLWPKLVKA